MSLRTSLKITRNRVPPPFTRPFMKALPTDASTRWLRFYYQPGNPQQPATVIKRSCLFIIPSAGLFLPAVMLRCCLYFPCNVFRMIVLKRGYKTILKTLRPMPSAPHTHLPDSAEYNRLAQKCIYSKRFNTPGNKEFFQHTQTQK